MLSSSVIIDILEPNEYFFESIACYSTSIIISLFGEVTLELLRLLSTDTRHLPGYTEATLLSTKFMIFVLFFIRFIFCTDSGRDIRYRGSRLVEVWIF